MPDNLKPVLADLLLAIADDKLMLGHRNSDWTGLGPLLEEDIAFSALAQDEMAHAQALYELAGRVLDRNADDLAFGRRIEDYRCSSIVELPDEFDWAMAISRQFFCDHYDELRLGRMARSSWPPLAKLAARLGAEEQLHLEHSREWLIRLGRAGGEAHQRMQMALDTLAPSAVMLFEPVKGQEILETHGVYPLTHDGMFEQWSELLTHLAHQAGLTLVLKRPEDTERGGRHGQHTTHLRELLDEMTAVYRTEPGAAW